MVSSPAMPLIVLTNSQGVIMKVGNLVQYRYKISCSDKRNVGKVVWLGYKRVTVQFECGLVVTRLKQSFYTI